MSREHRTAADEPNDAEPIVRLLGKYGSATVLGATSDASGHIRLESGLRDTRSCGLPQRPLKWPPAVRSALSPLFKPPHTLAARLPTTRLPASA